MFLYFFYLPYTCRKFLDFEEVTVGSSRDAGGAVRVSFETSGSSTPKGPDKSPESSLTTPRRDFPAVRGADASDSGKDEVGDARTLYGPPTPLSCGIGLLHVLLSVLLAPPFVMSPLVQPELSP